MSASTDSIKRTINTVGSSLVDIYAAIANKDNQPESNPPAGAKADGGNNVPVIMGLSSTTLLFIGIAFLLLRK